MDKRLNRVSNMILLATIAGSYLMWVVGIDTTLTSFMYSNSLYLLIVAIGLILFLNIKKMEKNDWVTIGFAVGIFVFYTLTSSIRHSNRFINAGLPIIILLVLCFKLCTFDKLDKKILLGITGISLTSILFRLLLELPKFIPLNMIGKTNNKIEAIWINTNTIGAAILFSVLMVTVLIKATSIGYYKLIIIPIYFLALIGIWAIESKTSLMVLILFILLDNIIPKKFLQKNKWWVLLFIGMFLIAPVIFYYCAHSESLNLFTGRERIWNEFFVKWQSDKQHMWIGMEPFTASWKPLGTHNSFLNVLANYGIVGYVIVVGYFSYELITLMTSTQTYSKLQVSLLLAFLIIWVHSFMEDIMTAYHWMPVVYSFIGIALQTPKSTPKLEKKTRLQAKD